MMRTRDARLVGTMWMARNDVSCRLNSVMTTETLLAVVIDWYGLAQTSLSCRNRPSSDSLSLSRIT